jgi:hypothetical protein
MLGEIGVLVDQVGRQLASLTAEEWPTRQPGRDIADITAGARQRGPAR